MERAIQLTEDRFLNGTDAWDLLTHVLDGEKWGTVAVAWQNVQSYLDGARVQQKRLDVAQRRIPRQFERQTAAGRTVNFGFGSPKRQRNTALAQFFRDIHFYLICWSVVGRDLALIRSVTGWKPVKVALRPYAHPFAAYKHMRDHLEHFDERLTGRQPVVLRQRSDLGNGSRDTYSFGGQRVDISWKSLHRLEKIVAQIDDALKREAWRQVCESDPKLAQRLVLNALRDIRTRRLLRSLNP